jgi:hypothetical protein
VKKFIFFFLILVIILGAGIVVIKFLKIQNVSSSDCSNELKTKFQSAKDKNIIESVNSVNSLLQKEKRVLDYSINLTLPFNLNINCLERIPAVAFKVKDGNYAILDKEGILIEVSKDTSLPKILSSTPLASTELVFVANLMDSLHHFYNVNQGKITENGLEIENISNKKVLFPLKGDKDVLLASLNLILSRLQGIKDASTIRTIDLRFKNPILR